MIKEVNPADKLEGELVLPPDKSISHRSALFAALHNGISEITNFSSATDPRSTLTCLRQLGVKIEDEAGNVVIEGVGKQGLKMPEEALDCGNSGTTMRLLSGIVGGAGITCTLTGDRSLSSRPMQRIIDPLEKMGITIEAREGNYAPLKISRKNAVLPITFDLPIPSAQLKSCVLLAGLFGESDTRVVETVPSRDHTERMLKLPVEQEKGKRIIRSNRSYSIPPQSFRVPNDFSAASFWLVAAGIHPSATVELPSVGLNPTRTAAIGILSDMGADIKVKNERLEGPEPVADLLVSSSELSPITITKENVPNCIDELPVLMVAMLFARGKSTISGAEELRHKETDRLAAMSEVLERAGAEFILHDDGIEIQGDPDFIPRVASYKSFGDHRIAMSAAILAMMGTGTSKIENAECTDISYPSFWDHIEMLTN